MGKILFKGQKNDVLTSLYSNFILLKRSKCFSTRIVPRSFATNDSFLTTYKNRMGKSEIWPTDPVIAIYLSQVIITNQQNFTASLGNLVPIFHNCSDHVYWRCTSSFHSSYILRHRYQIVRCLTVIENWKKQYKKIESLGKNGHRQKCLDKSLCVSIIFREIFNRVLYINQLSIFTNVCIILEEISQL